MQVKVTGSEELDRVGRRLRDAAGGGLVAAVREGLEDAARDLPSRVEANVARVLPRGGGLGRLAALSRVEVRSVAGGPGLEVTVDGDQLNVEQIDAGRVVHPVYGNRRVWVSQSVSAGAFTDPLLDSEPRLREGVEDRLRDLARHIERA